MYRNVVQVYADTQFAQRFEHLAMGLLDLVQLQADYIQVQTGVAVGMLPWCGYGQAGQQVVIATGQLMAASNVLVQALHLGHAQSGLQFGHAVVEAQIDLLVVPRTIRFAGHLRRVTGNAVTAQQGHFIGQCFIVGQCHAAFGGGDDFYRMKAEYGDVAVTGVTDELTLVFATNGVRCIFNNLESIALGQGMDGLHIARLATQVHGNDDFRQSAFAFGLFQLEGKRLRAEVVGVWVDIDKIHVGATVQRAVGRSHERDWRCPQPVARAKPEGQAGNVQCRGGTVDSQGMGGTHMLRHTLFKAGDHGALGQKIGLQYPHDRIDIGLGDVLAAVGNHALDAPDLGAVDFDPVFQIGIAHPLSVVVTGVDEAFRYPHTILDAFRAVCPTVDGRQDLEVFRVFVGVVGVFSADHLLMQFLARAYTDNFLLCFRGNYAGQICDFHRRDLLNVDLATFHIFKGVPYQFHCIFQRDHETGHALISDR